MSKPLRVLLLEDRAADAEIVIRELCRAGFDPDWKRVEVEADFLSELDSSPDLILADYSLPHFDGLRAVSLLRERGLDIPFILISGTLGEDAAVEAMRTGAADYLLKDRIARLGPAVERALEGKKLRDECRQMDTQLRESEERLRLALDAAHLGTFDWDMPRGRIIWSRRHEELWGFRPGEFAGTYESFASRVHPADLGGINDEVARCIAAREPWVCEFRVVWPDGSVHWTMGWGEFTLDENGQPLRMRGAVKSITDRKLAEAALRESEERFRELAETIHEVFWITDPTKRRMLYVSPAYERIWGRSCQSLCEQPHTWLDAIHSEDRERVRHAAVTRQAEGSYEEEYRIVRADGQVRWIRDRGFPVRNAAGQVERIVGVAQDITDRRQVEEQFRQSHKLEAIGQLAGGIAHDFNNFLAAMMMQVDLMTMEEDLSEVAKKGLQEILFAIERSSRLTRQLLLYSRRQVMQSCDLDLNEAVTTLAGMLLRIIREDVHLQLHLHPAPLMIKADPGMLDQVLMNLAVNARDAMPGGGRLIIETGEQMVDEDFVRLNAEAAPGGYVWLSVSDTGGGIPPEVLPRIFDPFFTTKEPGKGTGLGLATVFSIVKQHHGWVNVFSEPGQGAKFQIFLPSIVTKLEPAVDKTSASLQRGGTETILLTEDEPAVRALTRALLERRGYHVLEAANGVDALHVWQEHRASVALLLTDLVMPAGMTGQQLAQRLREDNPNLKVVFTSGYSAEIAGREFATCGDKAFIQKPFSPTQLLETVRRCLDDRSPAP